LQVKWKDQHVALMTWSAQNRVLGPSDFGYRQARKCAGVCDRL